MVEYLCHTFGSCWSWKNKDNQFGVINSKNTHITPAQYVRMKIPGRYAQSPYTNLSESDSTSLNIVMYYWWRYHFINYRGFDMYKLSKKCGKYVLLCYCILSFVHSFICYNWSFCFIGKSILFFVVSNPIDPPFEFSVGRVNLMDWFQPLTYLGQSWGDLIFSYFVTLY